MSKVAQYIAHNTVHFHAYLKAPLITALLNDPDANVRGEAAETLEIYVGQPGVEPALRQAMANDGDEGVRKYARNSLNPRSKE